MITRGAGIEDLKAIRKSRRNAPTRDTLMEVFPQHYREEVRQVPTVNPDTGEVGTRAKREWVFSVPLRDRAGRRTKDGHIYEELFTPYMRSEAERGAARRGRRQGTTEPMRGPQGQVQAIEAHVVEDAARRGWRAVPSYSGVVVEAGPQGMLFRRLAEGWEATGRTCLTRPYFGGSGEAPTKGIQRDPSGRPWRFVAGEWRGL